MPARGLSGLLEMLPRGRLRPGVRPVGEMTYDELARIRAERGLIDDELRGWPGETDPLIQDQRLGYLRERSGALSDLERNATVVPGGGPSGQGGVGRVVRLRDAETGEESVFRLSGEFDASPSHGVLGIDSPLGQALRGRKPGESVRLNTPGGRRVFDILEVR